jgi:TatD DNase family protein
VVWTDSHCHVQAEVSAAELLARAAAAGVARAVVVGTDLETSSQAVALVGAERAALDGGVELWATIGLHPHDAKDGVEPLAQLANSLVGEDGGGLRRGRIVAIGECGLDYHYDHSPRTVQQAAFAAQIHLAHTLGLALVIHTREAWEDTFAILDREGVPERTVFHCFTGGPDEVHQCLDRGTYLSFSGIVTFPKAEELHAAAVACPLESMLVETDSPLLAPVPHRGKKNEPSYLPIVGARIAALKGIDEAAVARATSVNAATAFGLPAI